MGTVTTVLFRHYEPIIQQASIFAIFITLITGTAGNTGTQSLAVAIRKIGLHEGRTVFLESTRARGDNRAWESD